MLRSLRFLNPTVLIHRHLVKVETNYCVTFSTLRGVMPPQQQKSPTAIADTVQNKKKRKKKRPQNREQRPQYDPALREKHMSGIPLSEEEMAIVKQRRLDKKNKKKAFLASLAANPETRLPKMLGAPVRYKMIISYFGMNFHGFVYQHPPNQAPLRTVQEVLTKHGRALLKQKAKFFPAGRTDSGVSAKGQVVSFSAVTDLADEEIRDGMNKALPADVRVMSVEKAGRKFDPMACKWKRYIYTLDTSPASEFYFGQWLVDGVTCRRDDKLDPMLLAATEPDRKPHLDLTRMRQAASMLEGLHDFKAFQSKGGRENTVRRVFRCSVGRFVGGQPVDGESRGMPEVLVASRFLGPDTRRPRAEVVESAASAQAGSLAMDETKDEDEAKGDATTTCASVTKPTSALDSVEEVPGDRVVIVMEGAGFLYNMCRIMAGTVLEAGFGTRSVESVAKLLDGEQERNMAGPTMPPDGLCMDHVDYDTEWTPPPKQS